jgi:hypothetical protein
MECVRRLGYYGIYDMPSHYNIDCHDTNVIYRQTASDRSSVLA